MILILVLNIILMVFIEYDPDLGFDIFLMVFIEYDLDFGG